MEDAGFREDDEDVLSSIRDIVGNPRAEDHAAAGVPSRRVKLDAEKRHIHKQIPYIHVN